MGLRNAFEEIATERSLRKLLDMLRFAKDNNDRLRVIIDNGPQAVVYMTNSSTSIVNAANQPGLFSTGSWNIMDAREPMRDQTLMAFQITRNRWTIT